MPSSMEISKRWSICTFLMAIHSPPTMTMHGYDDHYMDSNKHLEWFENFRTTLLQLNCAQSQYDPSMFTRITAHSTTILLVYVDNNIITGTHSNTIQYLQSSLQNAFQMKCLGSLTYFLRLEVPAN